MTGTPCTLRQKNGPRGASNTVTGGLHLDKEGALVSDSITTLNIIRSIIGHADGHEIAAVDKIRTLLEDHR